MISTPIPTDKKIASAGSSYCPDSIRLPRKHPTFCMAEIL